MLSALIEITESQLEPAGSSLHLAYQGKKYNVCDIRNPGGGCDFLKWDCEKNPRASRDPQSQFCDCFLVPITVKVPLKEPKRKEKKNKKPRLDSRRFQVCPKNVCDFFRWLDSGQTSSCKQDTKDFFGTCCSKHFLLKDHIGNQQEQNHWWEKNCREYKANSAPDLSGSLSKLTVTYTDPFLLEDQTNQQEQNRWWEARFRELREIVDPSPDLSSSSTRQNGAHTDPLTLRILTVASMAFTQIPRLLSTDSPDSVLILMR